MNYGFIAPMNMRDRLGLYQTIDPRARRLFEKNINKKGGLSGLIKRLTPETKPLHRLADMQDQIVSRHYAGRKVVDVTRIHGTVNRAIDFDYEFHPMNEDDEERWARVATALLNGVELPPLELVQVGDEFYVKDGHHRISACRALGYRFFDAIVECWEVAA